MTLLNKKAYKKRKKANQNDRISDLPINVIDAILANLRMRDQVWTSVLSKKWRYMWTSAPHLCFDEYFSMWFMDVDLEDPYHEIHKVIMDILMRHNGPIHKFSVDLSGDFGFEISMEKHNMWIPFMSKDIKHLELLTAETPPDEYQMPDILFSCKELTYFKFSTFNLSIPPNFCGFKKLLELHLVRIVFKSSVLESFMSGCPVLEKLTINECIGCDHLVISSPSLKVLALEMCETMSICLKKANNLIDFTLEGYQTRCFIKSLPKIKRFSVERCIKYPYADIPTTLLASSFSSLEYLKLDHFNLNDKEDILYFVNVLKSAPRLIELVIKQSYYVDTTQVLDLSKELESHNCCLKLKTVKVYTRACSQHAMSLIKSILANSPLLKILTVYFYNYDKLNAHMLLKISQDLLWMKRASPGAQVNFIHSTYGHY